MFKEILDKLRTAQKRIILKIQEEISKKQKPKKKKKTERSIEKSSKIPSRSNEIAKAAGREESKKKQRPPQVYM